MAKAAVFGAPDETPGFRPSGSEVGALRDARISRKAIAPVVVS
jgi:hypothetical protein